MVCASSQAELLGWRSPRARKRKPLPPVGTSVGDWEVCEDEEGKKYFYNTRTEESAWDAPDEVLRWRPRPSEPQRPQQRSRTR